MNKEEKQAIEEFRKQLKLAINIDDVTTDIRNDNAEILLNLIEKLQKENEELKTTNKIIINKEIRNGQPTLSGTRLTIIDILLLMIDFVRDYEKEFRANYADISVEQINLVFDYFIDNSIPVQKVKDKIRHYQELQDNYIKKYDEINEGLQAMINVLQEIIEEREEKNDRRINRKIRKNRI